MMTFGMSYERALQMAAAIVGVKSVMIKIMQVLVQLTSILGYISSSFLLLVSSLRSFTLCF